MWWTGFETASGRIASIDCFDIPAWKLFVCRDAGSILREEAAFNIQNIIANRKTWFKICLRLRRRFNAGNQIRLNQCISGYFALLNISKHSHQIWIGVDSTWFFIKPAFLEEILKAEWGGGSIYLQFPVNTRWPLTVDKMRLSCSASQPHPLTHLSCTQTPALTIHQRAIPPLNH